MSKLETPTKDLILGKMIGHMYWNGDTILDNISQENMEAGYELALALIESIYENATLAANAITTASGAKLNKRAKEMLAYIDDICSEVES